MALIDAGANEAREISSVCTVFAESEVVSLLATGNEIGAIVRGIHHAVATRTLILVKRVIQQYNPQHVAMSGGVANNIAIVSALSTLLEQAIYVPPRPEINGALGAALIAKERALRV
jgi:activator of 2-hydroxyglutaryl-CoA dehydratase